VRIRAILNPRAGLAAQRALEALRTDRASWPAIEVCLTEGPGDARRLARSAADDGVEVVLAVGGDGTANETAWGLLGSETALGIVPMGSGNGLARTIGLPLVPSEALDTLERAVVRRMDVGMLDDRPFLNVAGVGFDAAVGEAFHRRGRKGGRRGIFTYVRLTASMLFSYRAEKWALSTPHERYEGRALLVTFANGRQWGAAARLAPRARLDDGLIDFVVLQETPILELLANVPRLFLGRLDRSRRCRMIAASEAILTSDGPGEVLVHRDGEPEVASPEVRIRVEPGALKILTPAATAADPDGPFVAETHPDK
jgi:YegS/Rv2252/BmrU family lipid kinase